MKLTNSRGKVVPAGCNHQLRWRNRILRRLLSYLRSHARSRHGPQPPWRNSFGSHHGQSTKPRPRLILMAAIIRMSIFSTPNQNSFPTYIAFMQISLRFVSSSSMQPPGRLSKLSNPAGELLHAPSQHIISPSRLMIGLVSHGTSVNPSQSCQTIA